MKKKKKYLIKKKKTLLRHLNFYDIFFSQFNFKFFLRKILLNRLYKTHTTPLLNNPLHKRSLCVYGIFNFKIKLSIPL